jgi:phosphohistidine phosphatase
MRRLLLLRHAKTETDAPSGRDFDRRLDARGVADADEIGRWLARQIDRPQRVLVSTALRALQTWNGIAATLPEMPEVVELESLYSATPTELMRAIRDHGADASPLMVVAHNPGLHELAIGMTGSGDAAARRVLDQNLPTTALVTLDFDTATWSEAGFRRGHLTGIISPKMLREVGPEGS